MKKYEFAAVYDSCPLVPTNEEPCLIVAYTKEALIAHCEMLVERLGGKYTEVELEYDENFNYHLADVSFDENGIFLKAWLVNNRETDKNDYTCEIVWINN